ncbi:MAG: hypothetical protein LQ343_004678 [Gyalolechia ehrenbergii]|nr:MAG: hypothetical protein LQ343_004678 [Gyalolechia ehrenbergii]
MVEARKYTVRPYKPARTDGKDSFRIYLSPTALLYHGLRAGDICQLSSAVQTSLPAIAWPASEKIQDSIIQTTKILQNLYGLKLGDQIFLSRTSGSLMDAHDIVVSEHKDPGDQSSLSSLNPREKAHWAWLLEYELEQAGVLCPGMIFASVRAKGEERMFRINTIDTSPDIALYKSQTLNSVVIHAEADQVSEPSKDHEVRPLGVDSSLVGGLDAQLSELNSAMQAYGSSVRRDNLKIDHRSRRGGILLHGSSGTGKSMLLRLVAEAGWRAVFRIHDTVGGARLGDTEVAIQKIFSDAHRLQPSIVIIDDLDAIAGKKDLANNSQPLNIASSLCQAFDQRGDSQVLVLAATAKIALVSDSLRRPGRFQTEIEIPVPGTDARGEILHLAVGMSKNDRDHQLLQLANRTHGYVGADLVELVQTALDKAIIRVPTLGVRTEKNHLSGNDDKPLGFAEAVINEDIETALLKIQPTAMKEIFLDTPKVKWSQIGGQLEVKKALQKAVEWPLKHRADMGRLGLSPKKGLLLYGPPGCSKTLAAKAVATESNLNFIAVKGAEILSMYVGESERAVREIFRKARAASPSIVFFDEIDAIGASREPSSQGGLHVLTTLLNELDGIEALTGVFVLAATNRPEILDAALLRPGRLDSALYVGLPDYDTRFQICLIAAGPMDIGADVNVATLAHRTDGYSGAELVSIFQQAGYEALEEQLECGQLQAITMKHFERALSKVPKQVTAEMMHKYEAYRLQR